MQENIIPVRLCSGLVLYLRYQFPHVCGGVANNLQVFICIALPVVLVMIV